MPPRPRWWHMLQAAKTVDLSGLAGDEAAVAAGGTWAGLMRAAARALANGVLDVAGFGASPLQAGSGPGGRSVTRTTPSIMSSI